jgi:phosphoribosylformylglycinamidine synthase
VQPGDQIVVVGGRTGRDGIHGATFSSVELSRSPTSSSSAAVQIGDAITEKRVQDALLQARDAKLYRAITDCGAGGLSSAVGEMAEKTGARGPPRARAAESTPGLSPEEIWISEAQERMVLAVPPQSLERLLAVFTAEERRSDRRSALHGDGRSCCATRRVVGELDLRLPARGHAAPGAQATLDAARRADPGCPAAARHAGAAAAARAARRRQQGVDRAPVRPRGAGPARAQAARRRALRRPGDAAVLQPLASSRKGLAIAAARTRATARSIRARWPRR